MALRVALVGMLALAGCQGGGTTPPADSSPTPTASGVPFELHLSPADDGTTQQVLLGGKVLLDLPSESTWEYDEPADYPHPALSPYCPIPVGSGGEVFEAIRTGTTTLAYWRDGGPDRFEIAVEIVDGPGAAPPSSQLAGAVLRAADEGSTVHVPRNGVVLVALPGQASITDPGLVAQASGGDLVSYCLLDPQLDNGTWLSWIKVTAVREGPADLAVARAPTGSGSPAAEPFRATVVVEPVPAPGGSAPAPTPTSSATGAPFVLDLSEADEGRTLEVLRGGKVIVDLPDPDADAAGWVVLDQSTIGEQVSVRCGGLADAWEWAPGDVRRSIDERPIVLEVTGMLGTVPLEMVYVPDDEARPADWDVRDTFDVTLRIVDGPGAAASSAQIDGVHAEEGDDGAAFEVGRNGLVTVLLYGLHGLGRDWELVGAGEQLEMFCPPKVLSEGPGPDDMAWMNLFTFTAMSPGTAEVELEYRDSAEPDAEPLDTFRIGVTVR